MDYKNAHGVDLDCILASYFETDMFELEGRVMINVPNDTFHQTGSFSLFSVFSDNSTKCVRIYLSSIQRWDSNSQPLDRESPLITTRPGAPDHHSFFSHQKSIASVRSTPQWV